MIRKLRIKLVLISMMSLLMVLLIMIGAMNIVNYIDIVKDADAILDVLLINDGEFNINSNDINEDAAEDGEGNEINSETGQQEGEAYHPVNAETPYETRYFSAKLDDSGNIVTMDMGKIASIDSMTAAAYVNEVAVSGRESGFKDDFRYAMSKKDAETLVVFLDCTNPLATFRAFLFTSFMMSFIGAFVVFVLISIFSGRIVRPVSESYEKQKRFITDAGHEIKTPITIIDADAEVLEMDIGENEWLSDIRKQTKRLKVLTNDLIYLSRMEEHNASVSRVDFPISDIAEEVAQSFLSVAKTQNKNFVLNIAQGLSFSGDESAIRQLISILLDNALKYSPENGDISFELKKQGGKISIKVSNTAVDINKENMSQMFERFYRGDKSRNSSTGGHGIGLSIAKAVVIAHKGKIFAESPDGKTMVITAVLSA